MTDYQVLRTAFSALTDEQLLNWQRLLDEGARTLCGPEEGMLYSKPGGGSPAHLAVARSVPKKWSMGANAAEDVLIAMEQVAHHLYVTALVRSIPAQVEKARRAAMTKRGLEWR